MDLWPRDAQSAETIERHRPDEAFVEPIGDRRHPHAVLFLQIKQVLVELVGVLASQFLNLGAP